MDSKNGLSKYIKPDLKKTRSQTRSVMLRSDQIEFLNHNSLNLSLLVRDLIDKLIKDFQRGDSKNHGK
jgi:hypothetical protein